MVVGARIGTWAGGAEPELPWLKFTALQDGSSFYLKKNSSSSSPDVSLEYSVDGGGTWSPFLSAYADADCTTVALASGASAYIRAAGSGNTALAAGLNGKYYNSFKLTGAFTARGDITTLLSADGGVVTVGDYTFSYLFGSCTGLRDASRLIMPPTTIGASAYYHLFYGCSNLVYGPAAVPVTSFTGIQCMGGMFGNCSSLLVQPALTYTSTTVAFGSVMNSTYMNCTSLTSITIPYENMAGSSICANLANGCSSLRVFEVAWKAWPTGTLGLNNYLMGVPATGTFKCPAELGTNATIERGGNRCPEGWTVVNI